MSISPNTALPDSGAASGSKFSSHSIRQRRLRSRLDRLTWHASVTIPPIGWRVAEFAVALALSLLLLPVLAALYLIARCLGGGIQRTVRMGENAREFEEFSFFFNGARGRIFPSSAAPSTTNPLLKLAKKLPALANVLQASMSLVGPRSLSRHDIRFADRPVWKRFGVRPGLIGLWWVRKQANIAYDREALVDAEYADSRSVRTDLGILLRSLPAAFYGSTAQPAARRIEMLGIPLDNLSMQEAIDQIMARMDGPAGGQVCFVNADCMNIAQRDADYAKLLKRCSLVLADGIGVKLASNLLKTPICQNVNGTDLLPRLCGQMAQRESSVYLLGGRPGVADDVRVWMEKAYPGLRVSGCQHGYFPESEVATVVDKIRASGAALLLVAMGAPTQEKWIRDHAAATGVPISIGVGGLFDFYAGRIERAPIWVREIGMEWCFRLLQEPGRMWKRYLWGNGVFALRIIFARAKRIFPGNALSPRSD